VSAQELELELELELAAESEAERVLREGWVSVQAAESETKTNRSLPLEMPPFA
jgi:hypothetical protein